MSEKIARQRISIAMSHISAGSASAGSTQRDAVTVADRDAVIVACARTPIGSFNGVFASLAAPELGATAIRKCLTDSGVPASEVQEVFFGNVLSAGVGQAPARHAALQAGLPASTCCTTVNKVCSSGLKSIAFGAQSIQLNQADVVICGGMESMSNTPYYLPKARFGMKMGDGKVIDGMQHDGLYDGHYHGLMGIAGEKCAVDYNISRAEQDAFARSSYERAQAARDSGVRKWEMAPVTVPGARGGAPTIVVDDEELGSVKFEKFATMSPAFDKVKGTITAANASKLSDGASAVLLVSGAYAKQHNLPILARVLSYADAEQAPIDFGTAPSKAIPIALKRANLTTQQIDAFEINEAFAVVSLANQKVLNLDAAKLNVHGGSVALGHPLGSSGGRIVVSCLNVLRTHGGRYGCVGVCNGGGGASAMVLEYLGAHQ